MAIDFALPSFFGVRIVHVQAVVVEAAHHYPMRGFFPVHSEGADQDQRYRPRLERADQVVLTDIGVMYLDALLPRLALEAVVDQFHDLLFFLITHAVDKQRSGLVDPNFNGKVPAFCRQRQAYRVAAAMSGGHENGCGFAPQIDLFFLRGLIRPV